MGVHCDTVGQLEGRTAPRSTDMRCDDIYSLHRSNYKRTLTAEQLIARFTKDIRAASVNQAHVVATHQ